MYCISNLTQENVNSVFRLSLETLNPIFAIEIFSNYGCKYELDDSPIPFKKSSATLIVDGVDIADNLFPPNNRKQLIDGVVRGKPQTVDLDFTKINICCFNYDQTREQPKNQKLFKFLFIPQNEIEQVTAIVSINHSQLKELVSSSSCIMFHDLEGDYGTAAMVMIPFNSFQVYVYRSVLGSALYSSNIVVIREAWRVQSMFSLNQIISRDKTPIFKPSILGAVQIPSQKTRPKRKLIDSIMSIYAQVDFCDIESSDYDIETDSNDSEPEI